MGKRSKNKKVNRAKRMVVNDSEGQHLLTIKQVVYLKAYGSQTWFIGTEGKRQLISHNLGYFEPLMSNYFARASRCLLLK